MKFLHFVSLILLVSVLPPRLNGQEVSANPTRPSSSDNAFLTANGYAEIETGWSSTSTLWTLPTLLKVTIDERIELGATAYGLLQQPKGGTAAFGTPGGQIKYQVDKGPGGALATVFHVDWPSDGPPAYTFYPVLSMIGNFISLDATLGATVTQPFGGNRQSSFFYAVAASPTIHPKVGFYLELYGTLSENAPVHAIDAGISYPISSRLVVDLAVGTALTNNADDLVFQVGLTTTIARVFR